MEFSRCLQHTAKILAGSKTNRTALKWALRSRRTQPQDVAQPSDKGHCWSTDVLVPMKTFAHRCPTRGFLLFNSGWDETDHSEVIAPWSCCISILETLSFFAMATATCGWLQLKHVDGNDNKNWARIHCEVVSTATPSFHLPECIYLVLRRMQIRWTAGIYRLHIWLSGEGLLSRRSLEWIVLYSLPSIPLSTLKADNAEHSQPSLVCWSNPDHHLWCLYNDKLKDLPETFWNHQTTKKLLEVLKGYSTIMPLYQLQPLSQ